MQIQSLTSLVRLAENLKQQKQQASKLRRQTENKLKQAVSLGRRSTSGLSTVQKRLENSRERLGDINAEFNQILARKDSLERLIKTAQERITLESEAKDQAQIDLANTESDDARRAATERVSQIDEKISELESEIRQREDAVQKLASVIEKFKKTKMQTAQQIQKQTKSKPVLLTLIKKSKADSEKLKKQFEIASKKEDRASKNLSKINARLALLLAKKRKAAAKKAALKRAARKRLRQKMNAAAQIKAAAKKQARTRRAKKTTKKAAAKRATRTKKAKKTTKRAAAKRETRAKKAKRQTKKSRR